MPIIIWSDGVSKDHDRQRSGGLIRARAPETIAKGGEEERGGFTGDAGESQQNGGEDATISGWHDDRGDGFPPARAEGHGGLAQSVGHSVKKLFGAAQGDGNHHEAECEAAGKRGEMLEGQDNEAVSKNADDNGGHA